MTKQTVIALQAPVDVSFALINQFIDSCPEKIWQQKFGGWPVWQQVYHALSAVDFFTIGANLSETAPLCSEEVSGLEKQGEAPIAQSEMKVFSTQMQEKAAAYAGLISDEQLPAKNEALSQAIGKDVTFAGTMSLLSGHILYHLGTCDAALRQNGLSGVF